MVSVFCSSGKVLLKLLEHKRTQAWGSVELPEKVALMRSRNLGNFRAANPPERGERMGQTRTEMVPALTHISRVVSGKSPHWSLWKGGYKHNFSCSLCPPPAFPGQTLSTLCVQNTLSWGLILGALLLNQ